MRGKGRPPKGDFVAEWYSLDPGSRRALVTLPPGASALAYLKALAAEIRPSAPAAELERLRKLRQRWDGVTVDVVGVVEVGGREVLLPSFRFMAR